MKTLISFLLSLLCLTASAQQTVVTATVTVTGATVNGNTLVINGVTRLFTNNVTSFATQIPIGATVGLAASNIWASGIISPPAGITVTTNGAAAVVIFKANPNVNNIITIGGGWGTVTFSTNTIANATLVRVPLSIEGNNQQTNVASGVVAMVGNVANTNVIPYTALALSNFVNIASVQSVGAVLNFYGLNSYSNANQFFWGGIITNVNLKNVTGLSGVVGSITNALLTNPSLTNGQNFGNPFRSPGTGTASEQFGTSASAGANFALAVGNTATASALQSTAVGSGATAQGQGSIALGVGAEVFGVGSQSGIAIGPVSGANAPFSVAIGDSATVNGTNSMAIGASAFSSENHQIVLGTGAEYVSIPGGAQIVGGTTNIHLIGTNTIDGSFAYLRKDNTSVGSSINIDVETSTNTFMTISGASGAFSIAGFNGGFNGREIKVQNSSGQSWTITNDATDPTTANRIKVLTGSDLTSVHFATFIYSSALSRWVVESYY